MSFSKSSPLRGLAFLLHTAAVVVCSGAAAASNASSAPPFPVFNSAAAVNAHCAKSLKRVKALEQKLAANGSAAGANFLYAVDDFNVAIEDAAGALYLVTNVHPNKAVRDAAQACTLKFDALQTAYGQNEAVYQRLKNTPARDAIEARAKQLGEWVFEDAGVALPKEQRDRAKSISDQISKLGADFSQAVREDKTEVAFSMDELKGVPDAVLKPLKRDSAGKLLLNLDYPTYLPVMELAESGATRERLWRAKQLEGGEANLKRLAELAKLRREYAAFFGAKSYAEFAVRRRMAATPQAVDALLNEIKSKVTAREERDIAELVAAKAQHLGTPVEQTKIERWDTQFYSERVKKSKYAIDQEQFRQYFPPEASLQFSFKLAETIFGVKYSPIKQKLWHPDARAYEVRDVASNKVLGQLYVDLYPRKGKYNHAAVWSYRNVATRINRTPQAGLVVNFNRQGLSLDELETLLHEFGHSLHALLSQTRFNAQGGTSVQLDFVEAPSQMLEEWTYDSKTLALFKDVCAKCKLVPSELIAQAKRSKSFGKGIRYARQWLYASYDFALNDGQERDPLALWKTLEGSTPLGTVGGTMFPAGFEHLAGGYAAGYYSYLWSEVIGEDLKTAFAANPLDPAIGKRYRDTVLASGGEVEAKALVEKFLGRPLSTEAFYKFLAE
jgi:thimet oligopeptidase